MFRFAHDAPRVSQFFSAHPDRFTRDDPEENASRMQATTHPRFALLFHKGEYHYSG